jgi:carbon-monoxide dehydrogenase medium subunit
VQEDTSTTRYEAPETIADVLSLLQRYGDEAKLVAGGQSLMVFLRRGLIVPEVLIGLKRVQELRRSSFSETDGMQIGAMVTQAEIERSDVIREHYTALSEAAAVVASVQVRNQGTLGGNLCHADPTADPPAVLIALGATIEITAPDGSRSVPAEAFFQDYMEVDLRDGEVVTRIMLPPPAPSSGSAYLKHRVRQVDTAIAGAATWVRLNDAGSHIRDARIGLSGVGTTPLRAGEAEGALRDAPISDELLARAAEAAAADCDPLDDTEGSEWYRREMVRTLVRRSLAISLARARDGEPRSGS